MTDNDDRKPRPENIYWIDDDEVHSPPSSDQVLSLSAVAKMFGVSKLRLLYLELLGLISRRYRAVDQNAYGWADCERIVFILKAERAGLSLREVAPVIRATNFNLPASERRRGLAKCVALIDRLEKRRQNFEQAIGELEHICALLATELEGRDVGPDRL